MPQEAVATAVKNRLDQRWSSPDAIGARRDLGLPEAPVYVTNDEGDTPGDGSVFVQIQFPTGSTQQFDVAGTQYIEEGTIRVIVNMPSGAGTEQAFKMADMLAAIFRGKKFEGVQTYAPSPAVVDDRNDQGMYWPLSFAVPYDFKFRDMSGQYD